MSRWAAFLRAVNVGGRNAVPMAELRALFAELGCDSVHSYIASGNVVFAHDEDHRSALARRLEEAVAERFDVAADVILRTAAELEAVVRGHPFGDDTAQSYVTFLAAEPAPEAVACLAGLDTGPDQVAVAGRDVYLRYPDGYSNATVSAALLERTLGVAGTSRNWRTVERVAALAGGTEEAG